MSSLPSKFFPFDGECELSKGGDLELRFPDGTTLRTHVALMELVSPVLHTAVKDCDYSTGIDVEEDRKTWTLALNLMHPNGPNLHEDDVITGDVFSLLEPLLKLAVKYSINCILRRVDEAFYGLCGSRQDKQFDPHGRSYLAPLDKEYHLTGDAKITFFQFVLLSAKFDLATSWSAFSYLALKHVEQANNYLESRRDTWNSSTRYGGPRLEIDELISRLAEAGCHAAGCSLALKTFKIITG